MVIPLGRLATNAEGLGSGKGACWKAMRNLGEKAQAAKQQALRRHLTKPLGRLVTKPRGRLTAVASLISLALGVLGLTATPGMADLSVLGGGVQRLQNQLSDHRPILEVQAQQTPQQRARQQAIIGQLGEEIRRLTGRIEQLEFEQRTINSRVDQLIEDLDQRLRALEDGTVAPAGSTTGDQGQIGSESPNLAVDDGQADSANDSVSPEQALRDLTTPPGDGTLGSVPESAVAGLPRPGPDDVEPADPANYSPEQQYENAIQLLQAGDYQGAQGGLEVFLDLNEGHQLASNAAYWLAETHYVRQNYSEAAAAFARNYRLYGSESSKAIDNLLKLGMALANLGEKEQACLSYDELTKTFPKTPAHIQQALSRERARAGCS
ncbi:MAG: tetratricopeptide repeat protein [Geminicoccaceae bacterium]